MISLTVNGLEHTPRVEKPTLAELLNELSLTGKRIAVEVNGNIVPRSQYASTLLCSGDRLEVVDAVGGG